MMRLGKSDSNPFTVAYRVTSGCRNDDYMWGYYIGSRPSLLKGYRSRRIQNLDDGSVREVVDYWFPIWWEDDILAGLPEQE